MGAPSQPVLGIVAALPAEARSLVSVPAEVGVLHRVVPGVLLCVSGAGAEAAARGAHRLLAAGAQALLSWGSAGALAPDLRPGQLLVPERVRDADRLFEVDVQWRRSLLESLGTVPEPIGGTVVQSAGVLSDAAAKRELGARANAQAVDMESGALAAAARAGGARFLVIRAVADPAAWTLPPVVAGALDSDGRVQAARVLMRTLLRPAQWWALLRLARAFAAARRTLATVNRDAGPRFGVDRVGS